MRISVESLEFLSFVKKEIFPSIEKEIETELQRDQYRISDRSREWEHDRLLEGKSIWQPIDKWIYDNFNQNSQKVKEQYGFTQSGFPTDILVRVTNLEKSERSNSAEATNELVTLGIVRQKTAPMGFGGGGGSDYSLTAFGIKFMEFIDSAK